MDTIIDRLRAGTVDNRTTADLILTNIKTGNRTALEKNNFDISILRMLMDAAEVPYRNGTQYDEDVYWVHPGDAEKIITAYHAAKRMIEDAQDNGADKIEAEIVVRKGGHMRVALPRGVTDLIRNSYDLKMILEAAGIPHMAFPPQCFVHRYDVRRATKVIEDAFRASLDAA